MDDRPAVQIKRLGREGQPLVVIDNFVASPDDLIRRAAGQTFVKMAPHYPGIQAPADASYLAEASDILEKVLRDAFDIHTGARLVSCHYSLVATPPARLTVNTFLQSKC